MQDLYHSFIFIKKTPLSLKNVIEIRTLLKKAYE